MVGSIVPKVNREWLRQFRVLKGYTLNGLAIDCELSPMTYMSVECGAKPVFKTCTAKSIKRVAETLGVKQDLFYYKTDEEGRLIDKSAITPIFSLFASQGYKAAIGNDDMLRLLFSPELAEYIVDSLLETAS